MEENKSTEKVAPVSNNNTSMTSKLPQNKQMMVVGGIGAIIAVLVLIALAVVLLGSGKKSESLSESYEEDSFEFSYPEGWDIDESSLAVVTVTTPQGELTDLDDLNSYTQTQVSIMKGDDGSDIDEDEVEKREKIISNIKDGNCEDIKDLLTEEMGSAEGFAGLDEGDLNLKINNAEIDSHPACEITMEFELLGLKAKIEGFTIIDKDNEENQYTIMLTNIGKDSKGLNTGRNILKSFKLK